MRSQKPVRIAAQFRGISLPGDTALCEGTHTAVPAAHLFCGSYGSEEGCDMIAEWILIYAVVFILCAVVVGHVPTKH
jgi:hypothetical protein